MRTFSELSFDDSFVRELPGDPDPSPRRRQVHEACYSRVAPTPVAAPKLIAYAPEVAELIGLRPEELERQELVDVLAGNATLPGMQPYAACYGGHQFGNWAGQLGDGRAITLGEVLTNGSGSSAGGSGAALLRSGQRFELQLKGAGPTPYSRTADGRAVLRSSLREFLCSEAMHHLGVPTTRALSLVGTGEQVVRDMFYDGHPRYEPGAVVCRVAPSFLRFGNFEIFAARDDHARLKALADYTLRTHFPELGPPSAETYVRWFAEVGRRTAELMAHWMRVGFVHGVMNTDNMSILGLTIDYGPYGWLEGFDPDWTPNTTDAGGRRYRYGHQPRIGLWNLSCLASALVPLVGETAPLERALHDAVETMQRLQASSLHDKLGLRLGGPDESVVIELPAKLQLLETDMTLFFRGLAELDVPPGELADASDEQLLAPLQNAFYKPDALNDAQDGLGETAAASIAGWLRAYLRRTHDEGVPHAVRKARMNAVNPLYVLRNYLAQEAIDLCEQGDVSRVRELLQVLRTPYTEQPGKQAFTQKRPEWARHRAGCSMLSCSS